MRFVCRSVMHAGARAVHLERHLTEVARFQLVEDVLSTEPLEAHEIIRGNKNCSRALVAAGAAGEAI